MAVGVLSLKVTVGELLLDAGDCRRAKGDRGGGVTGEGAFEGDARDGDCAVFFPMGESFERLTFSNWWMILSITGFV